MLAVLNCAGTRLHGFLPLTRPEFDRLRNESPPRLRDVEWEDSESFEIPLQDIVDGLAWAREQVAAGRVVLVNCAQGKSRSGTMAVAYLVAALKLPVDEALRRVQEHRPLVQPNPAFMRALKKFEGALLQLPAPTTPAKRRLEQLFAAHDKDESGGLSLSELRSALLACGAPANEATRVLAAFDRDGKGELSMSELCEAWLAEGFTV